MATSTKKRGGMVRHRQSNRVCVQTHNGVIRVSRREAAELVSSNKGMYAPKHLFKGTVKGSDGKDRHVDWSHKVGGEAGAKLRQQRDAKAAKKSQKKKDESQASNGKKK